MVVETGTKNEGKLGFYEKCGLIRGDKISGLNIDTKPRAVLSLVSETLSWSFHHMTILMPPWLTPRRFAASTPWVLRFQNPSFPN